MSEPSTVNSAASTANSILSGLINDIGVNAALAAIKAEVPVLAIWPLSWIVNFIVGFVAKHIYIVLAQASTIAIITVQVKEQEADLAKATDEFKKAQASGDLNAITEARKSVTVALGNLVHFDGSATP